MVVGFANFYPLFKNDNLGASITTLNSSDNLTDFPTTYNANNTALNTGITDLEATTTMSLLTSAVNLASIGTITSGIWNGTLIDVIRGGTGSSTLTSGGVLYGLGTSAVGATGACTDGQTVQWTSGIPLCTTASVDLAGSYSWTGIHDFAATTTMATTTQFGVVGGLSPTGSLVAFASTTAPAGWLLADGTSYAVADYEDLFAVLGYSYGGAGANFNVPDVQERNIIMASTTANMGQTGGESNHTQTEAELAAHTHGSPQESGDGGLSGGSYFSAASLLYTVDTDSTGGGDAFNVLDPYIVMQYIIKY